MRVHVCLAKDMVTVLDLTGAVDVMDVIDVIDEMSVLDSGCNRCDGCKMERYGCNGCAEYFEHNGRNAFRWMECR